MSKTPSMYRHPRGYLALEHESWTNQGRVIAVIIEFRVANFRSIDAEQVLSFRAASDVRDGTRCIRTGSPLAPLLLRTAVLIGPNASGKSNVLSAVRVLRELVVNAPTQDDLASRYSPFYSNVEGSTPTEFQIDLLLEGVRYRYQLAYNAQRIVREELRVNITAKPQRWFARHFDPITKEERWEAFSPAMQGPREAWRKATGPGALFLSTAAKLNSPQLAPVMRWFEDQLHLNLSAAGTDSAALASHMKTPSFKERAIKVLRAADFSVTDIRMRDGATLPRSGSVNGVELLCERPERSPIWLPAEEYSSGAKRLIALLVPLLDGLENDRFVVIDEFDTHLHPLVARMLVQMIHDPLKPDRRVQVLLVSQTTALMDLALLRRDELWLMQMDDRNASLLRSLKTFSPRPHESIARGYLKGRYGALPEVATSVGLD